MNQIINEFMIKHPKLVKEMQNCDHAYSENKLNPYHIEGDVWCHTMMVCKEIELITKDIKSEEDKKELMWAALLHDVAKPNTRYSNDNRELVTFVGHESLGVYKSIDILKKQSNMSQENILNISLMVGLHSHLQRNSASRIEKMFKKNKDLLSKVKKLYIADNNGRYTSVQNREFIGQYNIETIKEEKKKNTINILIGPPLSGKTTYVNKMKKKDKVVISTDAILKRHFSNLGNSIKKIKTNFKPKDEELLIEILQNELSVAAKKGCDIYIDSNNLTWQERDLFINNNVLKEYNKKAIVMLVGYEELLRRNRTKKRIPNFIIEKECRKFNNPFYDEFDEIEYKIY